MSIFDRMDVDKLLQKPIKPELAEDDKEGAVAVAPPPVQRKVVFHPDPVESPPPSDEPEPQTLQRLDTGDAEPISDEPFALTSVPTLTTRTKSSVLWFSLYVTIGGLVILGAFFAGHWVGAKRPLF